MNMNQLLKTIEIINDKPEDQPNRLISAAFSSFLMWLRYHPHCISSLYRYYKKILNCKLLVGAVQTFVKKVINAIAKYALV